MKRSTIAAMAAVLLLTLTGCAGSPDETPSEPQSVAQATSEAPAPAETDADEIPLSVTPTTGAPTTPEEIFLARIRAGFAGTEIVDATDEQLLATGELACEQLADGVHFKDVKVVEGDVRVADDWYQYSGGFTTLGGTFLCPNVYPPEAPRVD